MTRKTCSIEGCSEPLTARGWCHFHYYRWQRWGDPEAQGRISFCTYCDSEWLYKAKGGRPGPLCPVCQGEFSVCQACKQTLPVELFYRDSKRPTGLGGRCKPCSSAYSRARNAAPRNVEQAERSRLKNRYGITPEQKQAMMQLQEGRCAICLRADEKLVIDHCHRKGSVRKLLCGDCNKGLGSFHDDPERLLRAAKYLTEHS